MSAQPARVPAFGFFWSFWGFLVLTGTSSAKLAFSECVPFFRAQPRAFSAWRQHVKKGRVRAAAVLVLAAKKPKAAKLTKKGTTSAAGAKS